MDSYLALEIDNFLDDFSLFRKQCDELNYEPVVNPHDGVVYPGICSEVPKNIVMDVLDKLANVAQTTLYNPVVFLRLSLEGAQAPHEAHTDATMGDIGVIVYLTRKRYCRGGTAFIQHKSGMRVNPETQEELDIWESDHDKYDEWDILQNVEMEPNRGFVFNTHCFHRAEKPQSFGDTAENGRLALICFASIEDGQSWTV